MEARCRDAYAYADCVYMDSLPLSVQLFIRAKIRTKGNTNIKNSLIRIFDTDKSSTGIWPVLVKYQFWSYLFYNVPW